MKKILFGSAAAICAAVGFSSFNHANNGTYYWFKLTPSSYSHPGTVSSVYNAKIISPAAATTTSTTLPTVSPCSGGSYFCLAGFTTIQLTANHKFLKTAAFAPATPFGAGYTQN